MIPMQPIEFKTKASDEARAALCNLDKVLYPALYEVLYERWRGKLFETLKYYWHVQDTKANQHIHPNDGYKEYFEAVRYSAKAGRAIATSEKTWQYRRILLHCLGLIRTRRPDPEHILSSIEKRSINRMRTKRHETRDNGYRAITYITTQIWQPDCLDYSEAQAEKWLANKKPVKYLTKEAIIHVFGQELANQVYCDKREIPLITEQYKKAIFTAIIDIVKRKSYATKSQVISRAAKAINVISAEKAWVVYGKYIMADAGYTYHRPTNSDKIRYSIKANDNRWIITPIQVDVLEADK